jgi:hypothetical protein
MKAEISETIQCSQLSPLLRLGETLVPFCRGRRRRLETIGRRPNRCVDVLNFGRQVFILSIRHRNKLVCGDFSSERVIFGHR